ncbi:MAG: ribosome-associated translation inhibitor RaiA [Hyphomicrobiales bacterium]|nr:ribosome-associated translation inhibitor RaiA [Hyphomicrobiales bacterium]
MTLRVSGKNMDIGEVLRGQIAMRVEQAVKRYFDGGFGGYAVVERDGTAFRTHCSLHLDTGIDLQASAIAHDPYASADISSERIEKRLRRYKRKLKERRPANASAQAEVTGYDALSPTGTEGDTPEGFQPIVVAEEITRLPHLSVGDAAAELETSGATILLFRHASSGRVNVVYRRLDGHVGWVDPAGHPDGSA